MEKRILGCQMLFSDQEWWLIVQSDSWSSFVLQVFLVFSVLVVPVVSQTCLSVNGPVSPENRIFAIEVLTSKFVTMKLHVRPLYFLLSQSSSKSPLLSYPLFGVLLSLIISSQRKRANLYPRFISTRHTILHIVTETTAMSRLHYKIAVNDCV